MFGESDHYAVLKGTLSVELKFNNRDQLMWVHTTSFKLSKVLYVLIYKIFTKTTQFLYYCLVPSMASIPVASFSASKIQDHIKAKHKHDDEFPAGEDNAKIFRHSPFGNFIKSI